MATSGKKSKVSIIIIAVLAVVAVGLGVVLAITYGSRYKEGVNEGKKIGKSEQVQIYKGDSHKGIVPDLVGQNASQVGSWSDDGERVSVDIIPGHSVYLPVKFKAPDGVAINKESAKGYKVASQEPAANTVFDVTYMKDSDGKEYDNLVDTMGVQSIAVTLEKIK